MFNFPLAPDADLRLLEERHAGIFVADQFVGTIGFHHFHWINRKTSLGYWLDAEYEGRGLMTAAARARRLLRHLMTSRRLDFRLASRSKPEGDSSLTSR